MVFTVIDGILAGVVVLFAIVGIVRGLFSTLSKPVKIIAAICLTFCIASPVITHWTGPYFTQLFTVRIEEYLLQNFSNLNTDNAVASLPFVLAIFARIAGIDFSGSDGALTSEEIISSLASSISAVIGNYAAVAVTYLALFLIISLLLGLVLSLLNKIFSKGVLGVINRLLGFVFGVSVGVVLSCLVAGIVSSVMPEFVGGFLFEFFKNFNPIAFILSF